MPELAFLKKLKGKWKAKGIYIQGGYLDRGKSIEIEVSKDGIQLVQQRRKGTTKRLLKYETFDPEKNEINLFYENEKRVSRYSLKLIDNKIYIAIRADIGKQNVLPVSRLPDPENLAWEYKRVQPKPKLKNSKD